VAWAFYFLTVRAYFPTERYAKLIGTMSVRYWDS
jgi:hypothetical protein